MTLLMPARPHALKPPGEAELRLAIAQRALFCGVRTTADGATTSGG